MTDAQLAAAVMRERERSKAAASRLRSLEAHFAERHAWLSKLDMPSLGMYDDE